MTLSELVSKQDELQAHLPTMPNRQQLWCAQYAEAGEIIQATKWGVLSDKAFDERGWCWWVRENMTPTTHGNLVEEFLDLLHFTLLEIVLDRSFAGDINDSDYEQFWQFQAPRPGPTQAVEYLMNYMDKYNHGHAKLMFLIKAAVAFGITREEIEGNFQASYDKNVSRWTSETKAV